MFVRQHMTLFNGWMRTQWPTNIPFINRRRFPARHSEKKKNIIVRWGYRPFLLATLLGLIVPKRATTRARWARHEKVKWKNGWTLDNNFKKDSNANDGIRTDPIESKSSQRHQIITTVAILTMTPMDHGVTPLIVAKSGTTVTLTSVLVIISAFHEVS